MAASLCAGSLDPPARDLSPVEAGQRRLGNNVLVCRSLNLGIRGRENYLNVAGMALVRVDATMCTVGAAAGFLEKESIKHSTPRVE